MDPHLWELLRAEAGADGDRVLEAVIRLARPGIEIPDVRIVSRFGTIVTCRIRARDVVPVRARPDVLSIKAALSVGPDFEPSPGPPDSAGSALPGIRPTDVRRSPVLTVNGADGAGVAVGFADWGVDVDSAALRWPADPVAAGGHKPGGTRLLSLWDQRDQAVGPRPDPYGYGSVHDRDEIDRALQDPRPYERLGYHPAVADLKANGTHGMRVADIAAGNGRAGGPVGIAPEADLIFVHLADRNAGGLVPFGDSVRLLEAVHFISRTAGSQPCVINISAGRICGPKDGTTLVERAFDELLVATPGLHIVDSVGNYRCWRTHSCGTIAAGETRSLTVVVDPADVTLNEVEIWYDGGDEFAVRIDPPGYTAGRPVCLGERSDLLIEGRVIGRVYHRKHDPNNGDNHIVAYLDPIGLAGNWTVTLEARRVRNGRFHAWIERDDSCPGCQARFTADDSNRVTTVGSIATSHLPLIVGAYNGHDPDRPAASFSSCGPTTDGRLKPDLVAPGVDVLAARSAPAGASHNPGSLVLGSGTSYAAPHVTGAVALCLQIAGNRLSAHQIRSLVLGSCDPVPDSDPCRYGRGYLNIPRLVADVQRSLGEPRPAPPAKEPAMDSEDAIMLLAAAPATAYREYLYRPRGEFARWIGDRFEIVARPGQRIGQALREGDVLLEVTLGRIGPGRCVTLAAPDLELVTTRPSLAPGRLVLRPRKRAEMTEPLPVEPAIETKGTNPDRSIEQGLLDSQVIDALLASAPRSIPDEPATGDHDWDGQRNATDTADDIAAEHLSGEADAEDKAPALVDAEAAVPASDPSERSGMQPLTVSRDFGGENAESSRAGKLLDTVKEHTFSVGLLRNPVPLTTARLAEIAAAQGIASGQSGIQFNRIVGKSFQEFALKSLGLAENFASFSPPGAPRIIPDSVTSQYAEYVGGLLPAWYPNSTFIEVKAVKGQLTLSSRRGQMRGFIEAAADSPAGRSTSPHTPPPKVILITTGDTVIGSDIIQEATRRGVAIWQGVVFEERSEAGTASARLGIGIIAPLNPGVYPGGVLPDVPSVLTGTLAPPTAVPSPTDPWPPEVESASLGEEASFEPEDEDGSGQPGRWVPGREDASGLILREGVGLGESEPRRHWFGEDDGELLAEADRGSETYAVWVQQSLNRVANAGLAVDGKIGPLSRTATMRFQAAHGLTADGIVGPGTEAALVAAGAPAPPVPPPGGPGTGAAQAPGAAAAAAIPITVPSICVEVPALPGPDQPCAGVDSTRFAGIAEVATFAGNLSDCYADRMAARRQGERHAKAQDEAVQAAMRLQVPNEARAARAQRIAAARAAVQPEPVETVRTVIRAAYLESLENEFRDTIPAANNRWGRKCYLRSVARQWMFGVRERLDFDTLGTSGRSLGSFAPPPKPAAGDQLVDIEPPATTDDGAKVQPVMNTFLRELRSRAARHSAYNYPHHGGVSFYDRGYSIDLDLSSPKDERGFFQRPAAVQFLLAIDAAARAAGVQWRAIYNDYAVAAAVNRHLDRKHVIFVGEIRGGRLNWHGPLILHFHLDIAPQPQNPDQEEEGPGLAPEEADKLRLDGWSGKALNPRAYAAGEQADSQAEAWWDAQPLPPLADTETGNWQPDTVEAPGLEDRGAEAEDNPPSRDRFTMVTSAVQSLRSRAGTDVRNVLEALRLLSQTEMCRLGENPELVGILADHLADPALTEAGAQLARGRVNSMGRADLGRITGAPSLHTLGVLAGASGHDVLLAHHEAYDRTHTGTIHGNRSNVPTPAGAVATDCTEYVLAVLGQVFAAKGLAAEWHAVGRTAAQNSGRGGLKGTEVIKALQAAHHWQAIFWAPDPRNPADGNSEHPFAYRKVRTEKTYYGIEVDPARSIINYRRTNPGHQADLTGIERLQRLQFGLLAARGGIHLAMIVNSEVHEVHWIVPATSRDSITATPLATFEWQSGVIAAPPGDLDLAWRTP